MTVKFVDIIPPLVKLVHIVMNTKVFGIVFVIDVFEDCEDVEFEYKEHEETSPTLCVLP